MPRSVPACPLLLALALPAPALAATSGPVLTDHLQSQLVAERDAATPGAELRLGLLLEHAPHWHTYWRNPGDSGLPVRLDWTLPEGVSAGDIAWPLPTRFVVGPLVNFGYEGRTLLPVRIALPADFAGERLDIGLHAKWLICKEECIPGEARYTLSLPVAAEADASAFAADFRQADQRQPQPAPAGVQARIAVDATQVDLFLSGPLPDGLPQWTLFPVDAGVIDNAATPAWFRDGEGWQLRVARSPYFTDLPATFAFLLSDGSRGLQLSALPLAASAAAAATTADAAPWLRAGLLIMVSLAALAAIWLALRRMSPQRPSGPQGDRR